MKIKEYLGYYITTKPLISTAIIVLSLFMIGYTIYKSVRPVWVDYIKEATEIEIMDEQKR
jgi:hypothetical protein